MAPSGRWTDQWICENFRKRGFELRYDSMSLEQSGVAASTAHDVGKVGSNRSRRASPFGLEAAWLRHTDAKELRRLAKLHVRIEQKEKSLRDLRNERTRIMNRCIRRMRRLAGKS
jgi:hypothetical protein